MLSWRHNGGGKLLLNFVGAFSGYGFRLSRAAIIVSALVFATALGACLAERNGFLVETDQVAGGGLERPGFLYAVDVLLPFVDLDEATRWRTELPTPVADDLAARPEPARTLLRGALLNWPHFLSLLGVFLTGLIGMAGAQRIQAAFARVEE